MIIFIYFSNSFWNISTCVLVLWHLEFYFYGQMWYIWYDWIMDSRGFSTSLMMGFIWSPKVFVAFSFCWERFLYFGLNVILCAGLEGLLFSFIKYCRINLHPSKFWYRFIYFHIQTYYRKCVKCSKHQSQTFMEGWVKYHVRRFPCRFGI